MKKVLAVFLWMSGSAACISVGTHYEVMNVPDDVMVTYLDVPDGVSEEGLWHVLQDISSVACTQVFGPRMTSH